MLQRTKKRLKSRCDRLSYLLHCSIEGAKWPTRFRSESDRNQGGHAAEGGCPQGARRRARQGRDRPKAEVVKASGPAPPKPVPKPSRRAEGQRSPPAGPQAAKKTIKQAKPAKRSRPTARTARKAKPARAGATIIKTGVKTMAKQDQRDRQDRHRAVHRRHRRRQRPRQDRDREERQDRRGARRPDPRQCRGDRRLFEGRRQGRRDARPGRRRI